MFSKSNILKLLRKEKTKLGTINTKEINNKHQLKKKGKDVLQIPTKEVKRINPSKIEKIKPITDEFGKTKIKNISQITTNELSDLESHLKEPGDIIDQNLKAIYSFFFKET